MGKKFSRHTETTSAASITRPKPWLPHRSQGVLWLCLATVCGLLIFDSLIRWEIIDKVTAISLDEDAPFSRRIPAGAAERHIILPGGHLDARWWVIHTEAMMQEGHWRVRQTSTDGAPLGREVHWSSLLMWTLSAVAGILSLGSDQPPSAFVAEAALYAGPLLLIVALGALCMFTWRRHGALEAAFYALVFLTSQPLFRTFQAGEADHHGIVLAFALAGILCILFGGGGCVSTARKGTSDLANESTAHRYFRWAGVFGAASMWVSAATAIPIFVGLALGACALAWFGTRAAPPHQKYLPSLWRTWGVSGCLASIGFYLLEYFPSHMGWRLEVNHPLYALAWLGGSHLLASATEAITRKAFPGTKDWPLLVGALLLVALPAVTILIAKEHVFLVADRFLLALHKEYIFEFQSLPTLLQTLDTHWLWIVFYLWPIFIVAAFAWLAFTNNLSLRGKSDLLLLAPATVLMQGLALYQVRWSSSSFALWSLCALVLFLEIRSRQRYPETSKTLFWACSGAAWLVVVFALLPQTMTLAKSAELATKPPIPQDNGNGILLRDIAHRLIRSSPQALPVVLSGPNSSTDLSFHGGIRTLGTLYWENTEGLKRAAHIFAAPDEASTLTLLKEAGVSHIIVPSWDNFAEAYSRLLSPGEGSPSTGFLSSVLAEEEFPQWLRPFAYPIPSASGLDADSVRILAVIPEQNLFESHFFQGVYHFESGRAPEARRAFLEAQKLRPGDAKVQSYLSALPPPSTHEEQNAATE